MEMKQIVKMSKPALSIGNQHVVMTKTVNCANGIKVVNKGKIENEVLIQGDLVNLTLPSGILFFGGTSLELDGRTVLGRAGQSLSICVVLDGELDFSYGERSFKVRAEGGMAQAVAVRLKHGTAFTRTLKLNQHIKKLHLVLTPEWFKLQGTALSQLPLAQLQAHLSSFNWQPSSEVVTVINQFFNHSLADWQVAFSAERLASLILQQMLEALATEKPLMPEPTLLDHKKLHHNNPIGLVVNYLEAQLHNDINLTELAHNQAMSVSSLQRKFKAEFGITIAFYIKERRLEQVMAGIKSGHITCIAEAAYQSKYQHTSNFVTAFKKKFAVTPGELIQHYQG